MASKIEIDKSDLFALNSMLDGIKNGVPRVLAISINKTVKTTQVQAVKKIVQELNLPAKRIKKDFKQNKANFRALRGDLTAAGDPVGLINFQARPVKKGVSLKVKKSSTRSLLKHTFIGRRGVAKHVFQRQYDGPRKAVVPGRKYGALPEKYRLPVSRLTGPRIEDIYASDKVYVPVQKIAMETYAKNVSNETKSLLRRFG